MILHNSLYALALSHLGLCSHGNSNSGSAGIILFLGSVHLAYTFLTHKFSPTEKQLETAMKQVAPRISGETTMWKV